MPIKKTNEEFLKEVKELRGKEYRPLSKYINSKTKVKMLHTVCNHTWWVTPNNFLRGVTCPYCQGNFHSKWTNTKFLKELNKCSKDYEVLDKYEGADKKLRFKHLLCGNIFYSTPYRFIRMGQRCPKCSAKKVGLKRKYDNTTFMNKVKELTNDEYTFLEPYSGSKNKIKVRHNLCGYIYKVAPYKFLDNRRCPYCKSSRGEHLVSKILDECCIDYISQKRFRGCKYKRLLPFDFYLPKFNMCIEYDGRQHYIINSFFGGKKGYELYKKRDSIKDTFCSKQGIRLIRIPYTYNTKDRIKNFLQEKGLKLDSQNKEYNMSEITFKEVKSSDLDTLMNVYHYLHRRVATKFSYGLFYKDDLVGMVTYSPCRKSLAHSISDNATIDNTLELSRLYIKDGVSQSIPNITSKFASWSLRQLKKHGNWYIISFADSGMHHVGAIYQATNFLYCGTTKSGIYCYNGPDKKGGQWVRGRKYRFFLLRSLKHRYIIFVGSKSFKKHAKRELKFELKPYPKQDNQHYQVGDKEERLIKDRKTNTVYTETELLNLFPNFDWNGNDQWSNDNKVD